MFQFILAFFGAIFSFITLSIVMSALIIGGIFWMYGQDLPSHENLANYTPPTISRIYSSQGKIMDEFAEQRRLYAPISEIPPLVQDAFVSAEDKNFWVHKGYDPRGIVAAALQYVEGHGRLRGASTITQQVMKNFLLSSDRSAQRKVKELILASRIEKTLSKKKILELYLNEIYLGQNSYGVAAAAQTYFNKTLIAAGPGRGGHPGWHAAGAVALQSGHQQEGHHRAPQLRAARDVPERLHRQGDLREIHRRADEVGAGGRLSGVPVQAAAARLLHRRDPPPAQP